MKANRVTKCFIIGETTSIPIAAVRAILNNSINRFESGNLNIVPAIKILRAVYPGLSLRDAKDMVDIYMAIMSDDYPDYKPAPGYSGYVDQDNRF